MSALSHRTRLPVTMYFGTPKMRLKFYPNGSVLSVLLF
jgi:hypothetical protein